MNDGRRVWRETLIRRTTVQPANLLYLAKINPQEIPFGAKKSVGNVVWQQHAEQSPQGRLCLRPRPLPADTARALRLIHADRTATGSQPPAGIF
jgi:hypothetical protein